MNDIASLVMVNGNYFAQTSLHNFLFYVIAGL